jgi:DNA-binding NarL/FixJ family response regulator
LPGIGKGVIARMSADAPLRVVIADDDAFARRLTKHALQARGMTVVAEAKDGREAVRFGLIYRPDLMVVDAVMPVLDGIRATREILSADPELLLVVLTGAGEDELGLQALRAGAVAVVPHDADFDALACAVEAAARGQWAIARTAG